MAFFKKSKKAPAPVKDQRAAAPDQDSGAGRAVSESEKECNKRIAVATYESQFPEKMTAYALEMANRMGCGIIAVNCANLTHDITEFFSNAHDMAFDEFKKNSDRNAGDFRTKAEELGLDFFHTVHFSNIDNAVSAVIKEYGNPEFIITENPAGTAGAGAKAKPGKQEVRILLVDDNPKFLNAVADRIRLQGYEPLTALNGKQALEIMESRTFQLAIIDQRLPDMDGLDLITQLKEKDAAIASTLLTGHGDSKLKEATEALESVYFEKEDMGSFWGFFRKFLISLGPSEDKKPVLARTFCVYSID
ncbi:MAG: response regulator [Desulfotignum sp.]|nr:response regulator [Desulfotignum sp.]MCF8089902.1 response regulator [Desulfotignum sp.]MCF8135759.1 response regulator [Desulfotignum sp.]